MVTFTVTKPVRLSIESPVSVPVEAKLEFLNIPALTGHLSTIYLN